MVGERRKRQLGHRQVEGVRKPEVSAIFSNNVIFLPVYSWYLNFKLQRTTLKTNLHGLEATDIERLEYFQCV
jgi:hypothetical protein